MYAVSELGSLAVVTETADARAIQAELSRLDRNLFLDQERDDHGRVFYVVKEWVGSEHPPARVVEWVDDRGPLPLSSGLVERVKRAGQRPATDLVNEAIAANDRRREKQRESSAEDYEYVLRSNRKRFSPAYSPALRPRFRDANGRPL